MFLKRLKDETNVTQNSFNVLRSKKSTNTFLKKKKIVVTRFKEKRGKDNQLNHILTRLQHEFKNLKFCLKLLLGRI